MQLYTPAAGILRHTPGNRTLVRTIQRNQLWGVTEWRWLLTVSVHRVRWQRGSSLHSSFILHIGHVHVSVLACFPENSVQVFIAKANIDNNAWSCLRKTRISADRQLIKNQEQVKVIETSKHCWSLTLQTCSCTLPGRLNWKCKVDHNVDVVTSHPHIMSLICKPLLQEILRELGACSVRSVSCIWRLSGTCQVNLYTLVYIHFWGKPYKYVSWQASSKSNVTTKYYSQERSKCPDYSKETKQM